MTRALPLLPVRTATTLMRLAVVVAAALAVSFALLSGAASAHAEDRPGDDPASVSTGATASDVTVLAQETTPVAPGDEPDAEDSRPLPQETSSESALLWFPILGVVVLIGAAIAFVRRRRRRQARGSA